MEIGGWGWGMGNEVVNGCGEVGFLAKMLEQIAAKRSERRRVGQFKFCVPGLFFNWFLTEIYYFFKKNGLLRREDLEVEGGLGKKQGKRGKEKKERK